MNFEVIIKIYTSQASKPVSTMTSLNCFCGTWNDNINFSVYLKYTRIE